MGYFVIREAKHIILASTSLNELFILEQFLDLYTNYKDGIVSI